MTVEHAQQLRERVTFQQRNDTGAPGAVTEWTTQFTLAARLKPRLTGSEDMIAGRMTGQQPYILTVPVRSPIPPGECRMACVRCSEGDGRKRTAKARVSYPVHGRRERRQ
jgi:head-tail adaptor